MNAGDISLPDTLGVTTMRRAMLELLAGEGSFPNAPASIRNEEEKRCDS
jgi:hypothetical protein